MTHPPRSRTWAYHWLLAIALHTGRRLAEIAAMTYGDVRQLNDGRVAVTFPHCKGGKVMRDTLPLAVSRQLLAYLYQLHGAALGTLEAAAPVWVSLQERNGTHGHTLTVRAMQQICEKWLATSKFHALRHTYARALEDAGAKVSDIQAQLGHASLQTTGRYLAALRAGDNPHSEQLAAMFGTDLGLRNQWL